MNASPVRLVLVNNSLDVGGAEKQLAALALRLDRERFRTRVVSLTDIGPLAAQLIGAGIEVRALHLGDVERWTPFTAARGVTTLAPALRGSDIAHSFLSQSNVLTAFAGRWARVGAVVAGRRGLFHPQPTARRIVGALATRLANVIVANSQAVRQDVMLREHVSAGRIRVIANGIDLDEFDRLAAAQGGSLAVDGHPVVAVVANLHPYKGHVHFIDAWSRVRQSFPSAIALFIGDGAERIELQRRVLRVGLNDSIRFLGRRSDVPAILRGVDLVVQASLEEGLSNSVMEAMAAERPVVATNVGGSAELVDDGSTGLLVRPADPQMLADTITQILSRPDQAAAMGRAGRRRMEALFSMRAMVEAHVLLYESLLVRSGR